MLVTIAMEKNMAVNPLRLLRKRPSQQHVPRVVRKIWLARECFDDHLTAERLLAEQKVVYSGADALVLRGRSFLKTSVHPSFSQDANNLREVNTFLWVRFRERFSVPPAISIALADRNADYWVTTGHIAEDGFQASLIYHGTISVPEVEIVWKAAGFPEDLGEISSRA